MSFDEIIELHHIINQAEKENWAELDLSQYDIDFLPPEIGKLKNLQSLNLYGNSLETLPADIGNLRNLVELKLGENLLVELPQEICNLKNLVELRLDQNKLKFLPLKLGRLENLRHFSASENEIKHIPTSIGELHQLETLFLNGNQITELPPNISKLKGLHTLNLSHNGLKHLPDSITEMVNLRLLDISHNQLGELPPLLLLDQLEELHINHNHISSPLIFYNKITKLRVYSYKDNLFDVNDVQSQLPAHLRKLAETQEEVIVNNSEKISEQELLAREFESWQKQYYDDVYSLFEKKDGHRLVIALERWEDRFVLFLRNNFPRLVDSYETQTTPSISLNYIGDPIQSFKPYRSNQIEAFLTQCIEDARKGNLDNYYIALKSRNRTSRTSTKKKSNQNRKREANNITYNIYGDIKGSNIIVGNDNTVNVVQQKFGPIYEAIEASARDATEIGDLFVEVDEIKGEVAKGDQASESFLSRRFRNLKKMAPDIAEVALSTLGNPAAGLGMVVQKVAKKIKEETK